ncbi:unnamed protein product [Lactuca virosa]|uniref:Uncharacterized protein n=1 Tax=Lactuca virosa TaxID=75947 RepID=A0AAU9NWI6_9ASTR|nr:unnamed protein product [Lactuca virosa]
MIFFALLNQEHEHFSFFSRQDPEGGLVTSWGGATTTAKAQDENSLRLLGLLIRTLLKSFCLQNQTANLGFRISPFVCSSSTPTQEEEWVTRTSGTRILNYTDLVLELAVYVVTRMDLSESMGSCAADSASTAMPRKLALLSIVD